MPQGKDKKQLLTVPQTFDMAINTLVPLFEKMEGDDRETMLAVVEYMRAVVEAQSVVDKMIEAATQNFTMALEQRDQALRILSMWQEHGVDRAMEAAAEFYQFEIDEGVEAEDVQRALRRALGFEIGHVDMDALADFYESVGKLAASVRPAPEVEE